MRTIQATLLKNPPSLVHAFFWTSGLAALTAARGHGVPLVQTFGTLGVAERRHGSHVDGRLDTPDGAAELGGQGGREPARAGAQVEHGQRALRGRVAGEHL